MLDEDREFGETVTGLGLLERQPVCVKDDEDEDEDEDDDDDDEDDNEEDEDE